MIRAVIDTNVLVSGLLSPSGNQALILLAVHQGLPHPCFSEAILDEYAAVLARAKFSFPPTEIAAVLAMLRAKGELIAPQTFPVASPDPADTKFLHCAIGGEVEFIVTGNKNHFPDASCGTALVVNATELLDRITMVL